MSAGLATAVALQSLGEVRPKATPNALPMGGSPWAIAVTRWPPAAAAPPETSAASALTWLIIAAPAAGVGDTLASVPSVTVKVTPSPAAAVPLSSGASASAASAAPPVRRSPAVRGEQREKLLT